MVSSDQEDLTNALIKEAKYYYNQKLSFKRKMMTCDCDLYIINDKWLLEWKKYVSYSTIKPLIKNHKDSSAIRVRIDNKNKPRRIDNCELFIPFDAFVNNGNKSNQYNYIIPNNKKVKRNFRCINKEIWELFEFKYSGGPMIIKHKAKNSSLHDCLYSIQLNVLLLPSKDYFTLEYIQYFQPFVFYAALNESIVQFKDLVFMTLKSNNHENISSEYSYLKQCNSEEQFVIWQLDESFDLKTLKQYYINHLEEIKHRSNSLQSMMKHNSINLELSKEASVKSIRTKGGLILIVLEYIENNIPIKNHNELKVTNTKMNNKPFRQPSNNIQIGLSGLINLGNTCFMNASIQCLSNCGFLTDYFVNNYHKAHINKKNPLGSKGVLVSTYAELLKSMWNGSNTPVTPTQFKSAISSFQSLFSGFSQHDTHEFLIYLLDGFHEDLNLVERKPYIKEDDSINNKDDAVLYKLKWINFLQRNQSIIGELFYGVYKSTIYCLNESCGNILRVFEPYLSVNVPLTVNNIDCFFLFYDISISPIQIKIPLENDRCLGSVRKKLGLIFNVKPFSFLIAYINGKGTLNALYSADKPLREIERIFCFQINPAFTDEANFDYSTIFSTMEKRRKDINEILNQDGLIDSMTSKQAISYTSSNKSLLVNIDNNNYLPQSFIKVILFLFIYNSNEKKKIMFPRIIYVKKRWTTQALYAKILSYFSHLIKKQNGFRDNENLFSKCFPNLGQLLQEKTELTQNEQSKLNYPFILKFRSLNETSKCYYCGKFNCKGCLIPCNNQMTVLDIISEGTSNEKDNTYYYIPDIDKKRYNIRNNDFEIEVLWLETYYTLLNSLNERTQFNFSHSDEELELSQCLKRFEYPEILQGENKVYCSKCKSLQKVEKQLELYTTPKYLIIQLKRFNRNGKVSTKVNFPLYDFNISKYVKNSAKDDSLLQYDLIGIANHLGNVNGGHYIAYAKNYINNNWYEYNDSQVSLISENSIITSNAYVLFYQMKSIQTLVNKEAIYTKQFIDYSKK